MDIISSFFQQSKTNESVTYKLKLYVYYMYESLHKLLHRVHCCNLQLEATLV